MNRRTTVTLSLAVACLLPCVAQAGYTITQGDSAPTYSTTLNFDEPGGPTGVNVPNNSWAVPPYNITDIRSGDQVANFVGDNSLATGQSTNSYFGPFGVFMTFANDLTEMSLNAWDSSGPGGPFGGGAAVVLFDDGAEVASLFFTPAFGVPEGSAFNITTDGGSVFDDVRVLGFGFPADTYVDNLSWNVVPEPTCGLLATCAGFLLMGLRRR